MPYIPQKQLTLPIMFKWLLGPQLSQKTGMLSSYTAALGFYFILSLVPFLMITFMLSQEFLALNLEPQLGTIIKSIFPPEAKVNAAIITATIKKASSGGFFTFTFALALLTSMNFMNELVRALHYLFSDPKKSTPSGWKTRLQSLLLLAIWMATLIFIAFFLLFSPSLQGWFRRWDVVAQVGYVLWTTIRYSFLFVVLFAAFYLTYRVIPHRTPSDRYLRQGALLAACGWIGLCFLFANVVPRIWAHNPLHGALSSIIATLIWAQCCAWVVLLGACWIVRFDQGKK